MHKLWFLLISGCALVIAGFSFLATSPSYAQSAGDYVGSRECGSCHRDLSRTHALSEHSLTLQDVSDDKDAILASFDSGEDIRTVTFPGDEEARAFTANDVAFTIGTGRYVQRYLYEVDDDEYRVFPAEWNTQTQTWQPFALSSEWDEAYDWNTNCAACHTTAFNADRGTWRETGVQCEACHGPGVDHVEIVEILDEPIMGEDRVLLENSINSAVDAQVCGQCHSRGETPYPTGYFPGMDLSETFTLSTADDPVHWWATGHASQANMQYNEWLLGHGGDTITSVMESDYFSPSCLECHSVLYTRNLNFIVNSTEDDLYDAIGVNNGDQLLARLEIEPDTVNPDLPLLPQILPALISSSYGENVTLPALAAFLAGEDYNPQAVGVTCASCHNPHSGVGAEEGAVLPEFNLVSEPYALCVTCHSNPDNAIHHPTQEFYEGITFIDNVEGRPSAHFVAEEGPDCITCHMPSVPVEGATRSSHTMSPILPGEAFNIENVEDSCLGCHGDLVNAESMQALIDAVQTDTVARIERARAAITESTPEWVTTALDVIEGDGSAGIHNYAYTDALLDAVDAELGLFGGEE